MIPNDSEVLRQLQCLEYAGNIPPEGYREVTYEELEKLGYTGKFILKNKV